MIILVVRFQSISSLNVSEHRLYNFPLYVLAVFSVNMFSFTCSVKPVSPVKHSHPRSWRVSACLTQTVVWPGNINNNLVFWMFPSFQNSAVSCFRLDVFLDFS